MKTADLRAYQEPVSGPLRFIREQIVLPDGRTVGAAHAADPWIERDLLGPVFERRPDGLPRYSLVYLELARGQWKSGGAAAVAVAEAVLEPSTDVVVAAADRDQAAIVLDHIDGYLHRNPNLAASFKRKGDEVLVPARRSRIRVISSDAPTAWGLGGVRRRFRIVCDELTVWKSDDLWVALSSATGKVADAQTIVLSNAGFDAERSWQFKVRRTAERADWAYLFSPRGEIASWIRPEWIAEMRMLLPAAAFDRVIGNVWVSESGDFVTREQWARCVDERWRGHATAEPGRAYFAGLDLGLTKDRTALAIVHVDGDKLLRLDELVVYQGSRAEPVDIETVERAVIDAARRFPGLRVAADPWQLQGSIQRLRRGGVQIEEFVFSAASVAKLSTTLYSLVTAAALRVPPDRELEREILGLQVIQTASGWRVDHRAGGYSDRCMGLAMAAQVALGAPGSGQTGGGQYCSGCGRPSTGEMCGCRFESEEGPVTHRGDLVLLGDHHVDRPSPAEPGRQSIYTGH